MSKHIWLINQYAMPPEYEVRIQTLKRAQYLQEFGYEVTIISGSYLHNTEINLIKDRKPFLEASYNGINYIHIRTSKYSGNGIRRIYNLIEFPVRFFLHYKKFNKPDIIDHLATVPFGNILYFIAKKIKARYIVDVVDLWPESFVAMGLVKKNNMFLKLAYRFEKWLYEKADDVVFSMEGGLDYIIEKGWNIGSGGKIDLKKIHYINNGVDVKDFDYNKQNYLIEDKDLEKDVTFKVIYIGSVRLANNLKLIIDAAKELIEHPRIVFLIYGDGDDRLYLEKYCKENNIANVIFKQKWVELKYVPYILSKSSLNLLNYKQTAIERFGGSQSKSFQYMASGRPIVSNIDMAYCPIKKFRLGIAATFKDAKEYADAILKIASLEKEEYIKLCENSRKASYHYDYKELAKKFIKIIE